MNNFGVFINPFYTRPEMIFDLLKKLNITKDVDFYCMAEQKEIMPNFIQEVPADNTLDCILSFGGDGTFLQAMHYSLKYNSPLLGINVGKLGFLSDSNLKELESSIDHLKKNKFKIQKRMLLRVQVKRQNEMIFSELALNDAVIYKGETPRLTEIKIFSNKRFVLDTRCDGIIISTPTGSTAYSLSAGGPLLSPVMDAIIMAPLNPHNLSVRPMVFAAKDKLEFEVLKTHTDGVLQLDGKNTVRLKEHDLILITSAARKMEVIKLSNKTFYQILRKKLHMGRK